MTLYTQELLEAAERWTGILPAPSKEARKHPKGIRVFKSSILEYGISRAHWTIPGLWVIPLSAYLFSQGIAYVGLQANLVLTLAGLLSWTLLEYVIHMGLFHLPVRPGMNRHVKMMLFMLHGYHHEYPNDPSRLVMPIAIAWPLAVIVAGLIWAALGTAWFFGFFTGILIGYLGYDWIHYAEHHFRPRTRYGHYVHELHVIHHFIDQNSNFGISSPLWDFVFGKVKRRKIVSS